MRIGILTLPLHTNYGGILQAYALQTVLERMGHEVCLIEEKRKPLRLPLWKAPISYGKRILKNLTGHPFPIFYEQKINREAPIMRQNTDKFIKKYIKRRVVETFSEIKETDFDVIVVGSDQIWRPKYFQQIKHAYLDFAEGWKIHRISYAASFGTEKWEYTSRQTMECSRLLKYFNAVSVREQSGVRLCEEYLNIKAVHVLDPTMLLSVKDYIKLFKEANTPKSMGNLLCYILDETSEKKALIDRIAKDRKLVPFYTKAKGYANTTLAERIHPSVEQWLRGFYDAEFVITDSFHACVFSILFNKPFVVIGNVNRGLSRFQSLLNMFRLTDRMVSNNFISLEKIGTIDWNFVSSQLELQRKESMQYLIGNI